MDFDAVMSPEELKKKINIVLDLPLHRFLDLTLIENRPGYTKAEIHTSENTINNAGVVHGGIIYSLLDFAAYIALLPLLKDTQTAATNDIHVSVMRAAPGDKILTFEGRVRKVGKRMAFCDSEAWCEDKLVATGHLSKSIIDLK